MVILECLIVGIYQTNCYLFGDDLTKEIAIIDPGDDAEEIIRYIQEKHYKPVIILITHEHFDHTNGAPILRDNFKIPIRAAKKAHLGKKFGVEQPLFEGDQIKIGGLLLDVFASPGHSNGGLIYVCFSEKIMFVGDTLFQGSIGRTDLGGDYQQLMLSIKEKIMNNPRIDDSFQVMTGHGSQTEVGLERKRNPFRNDFL